MPQRKQKKKGGKRPVVQGPRTQSGAPPRIIYVDRPVKKQQQKRKAPVQQKGLAEKVGGFLGRGAKAMFKAVTGFGDYKVGSNTLMGGQVPQVRNSPGGTIVRHREYVTDVLSSSVFTNDSYPLNPGMDALFPWLSATAQNYEEYEWRGVILEFRSLASSLNASSLTSGLGVVIMATQYNPLDPDFPDKRTMENYEFATSNKPSEICVHPIECKRSMNTATHLYVRTGSLQPDADIRLYDLGNFQIARQGMPSDFDGTVIGELWVTYEVEFFKPKLVSTTGASSLADDFVGIAGSATGNPMGGFGGANGSPIAGSTCGCIIDSSQELKIPSTCHGRYQVNFNLYSATNSTTTTPTVTGFTNTTCKVVAFSTVTNLATQSTISGQITGSMRLIRMHVLFDCVTTTNGAPNVLQFPGFTSVNSDWQPYLSIVQVPPTFNNIPATYP